MVITLITIKLSPVIRYFHGNVILYLTMTAAVHLSLLVFLVHVRLHRVAAAAAAAATAASPLPLLFSLRSEEAPSLLYIHTLPSL